MEPGQEIGHYRILEALGTGAQGAVYLAEDLHLGRRVALKVLFGAALGQSHAFLRFRREAEAASRLDHPGICTVYDADHVDDTAYIAMRYLEGEPLTAAIERVRAAVAARGAESRTSHTTTRREEVFARIRIIEQVAHALHAAHEVGLVHRDVKPSNIMLLDGDEPVLCDFGLVHDEGPDSHALTRTGDVFGTPLYMSPEQIQGKKTDRRSDVFSLGVVAYELLTGHRPFGGATYADLYQSITQRDPPDPARLGVILPRDLGIVLETALDKDPDRRYATAALFAADLRRVRAFEPIHARPIGPWLRAQRWVQRRPATATALALAALIVVGGPAVFGLQQRRAKVAVTAERDEADRQRRRAEKISYTSSLSAAAASLQSWQVGEAKRLLRNCPEYLRGWEWRYLSNLADSSELIYELEPGPATPSVVPGAPSGLTWFAARKLGLAVHGDRIAFGARNHGIHVLDLASGKLRTTVRGHTHNVVALAFSPDGTRLASASWDRTARILEAETGAVLHTLTGHGEGLTAVTFTPDGASLVTCDSAGEIRLWDVATGACRMRTPPHAKATRDLVVSRDGLRLYVVRDHDIEEVDAASLRPRRTLIKGGAPFANLALHPSGTRLATHAGDFFYVYDLPAGECVLRVRVEVPEVTDLAYAAGGKLLVASFKDGSVCAWDAVDGAPVFRRTGHDRFPAGLVWAEPHGLISWGMDQTLRRWPLTPCFARISLPVDGPQNGGGFDPTATRLVTAGWSRVVSVFDVASGRRIAALQGHRHRVLDAAFSPDGTTIASLGVDGTVRLWEAEGGAVLRETGGRLRTLCFSPDGRWLAFGGVYDRIVVWDLRAGRADAEFPVEESVADLEFDPGGTLLAASLEDGTIRIWDMARRELVAKWLAHAGGAGPLAFDPERRLLLSGGGGEFRMWELGTWRLRRELRGHGAGINVIAVSLPERRYFTASADRTMRVWDADRGELLVSLLDVGWLTGLSVSPDGRTLAVIGHSRNVRLLEADPR